MGNQVSTTSARTKLANIQSGPMTTMEDDVSESSSTSKDPHLHAPPCVRFEFVPDDSSASHFSPVSHLPSPFFHLSDQPIKRHSLIIPSPQFLPAYTMVSTYSENECITRPRNNNDLRWSLANGTNAKPRAKPRLTNIDIVLAYHEDYEPARSKPKKLREVDQQSNSSDSFSCVPFLRSKRSPEHSGQHAEAPETRWERVRRLRECFEQEIQNAGLLIERQTPEKSFDARTGFLKIHAPFETLARHAELLRIKMPLRRDQHRALERDRSAQSTPSKHITRTLWTKLTGLSDPFELPPEFQYLVREPRHYSAAFNRERMEMFLIDDPETFFQPPQRIRIVWDILTQIQYRPNIESDELRTGIEGLVKNDIYAAAYPLHDGPSQLTPEHKKQSPEKWTTRQLLYNIWARKRRLFNYQPLWLIRQYFGVKVGLYFAWLGFYTFMLVPPSIAGILAFAYGMGTNSNDQPTLDICNPHDVGNLPMCPQCPPPYCSSWKMSVDSCWFSKFTQIFDNEVTVLFAAFMSIWSVVFLETWKRYEAGVTWKWNVMKDDPDEESIRPEYEEKAKHKQINPITLEPEPFVPAITIRKRLCLSLATIAFFVAILVAFFISTIVARVNLMAVLHTSGNPWFRSNARFWTMAIAASAQLIVTLVMEVGYIRLSYWLTELECPKTTSEFERSYTYKVVAFEFINYYVTPFYIAFFKGRFWSRPEPIDHLKASNTAIFMHAESCDPAGCMSELCVQLAITMIGKQTIQNVGEVLYPILQKCFRRQRILIQSYLQRRRKARFAEARRKNTPAARIPFQVDPSSPLTQQKKSQSKTRAKRQWEKDFCLVEPPQLPLVEEYLEMIIQYGFVTLFTAAFPLAPLFALVNNVVEIRTDAYKFVILFRRPISYKAQTIGAWYSILSWISKVAVLTNASIIAFTSDFIPRLVYRLEYSSDMTLMGYMKFSLTIFNITAANFTRAWPEANLTHCYYREYLDEDGARTKAWWHINFARLVFIMLFGLLTFTLRDLIAYLVPDVPRSVREKIQRENYLARKAFYEYEVLKKMRESNSMEQFLLMKTSDSINSTSKLRQVAQGILPQDENKHMSRSSTESWLKVIEV